MPSAASSDREPEGIASSAALLSMPPRRMMDPLPNCFSICDTAKSRARDFSVRSSAITSFQFLAGKKAQRSCASWWLISFYPLRTTLAFQQEQLFADKRVELVRAGRILGKAAH